MDDTIFCAVKDHKVEEPVCSGIIMKADAATIQTCRTCARGQALARTTSIEVKQLDPAAVASAPSAQPTKNRAWELIVERTGCTSQEQLARKIGGTYQSKISQIVVKLGKGIMPSGRTWDRLLEITGLMPEELLLAAGHLPSVKDSAESTPGPLRGCRIAFSSQPPAPASSSLPTPSGPDAPSPAAPEGPAGHMMRMQDAPDKTAGSEAAEQLQDAAESPGKGLLENPYMIISLDTMGEYASETKLIGIEVRPPDAECECNEGYGPCDACASCRPGLYVHDSNGKSHPRSDLPIHLLPLLMLDEIPGKGLFDPNVGDYVPLETEGEALAEGSGSPAAFEQGLFAETPETPQATAEACAALPADFLPYTGGNRSMIHSTPALNVKVTGDVELSAGAVREFGLRDVRRVQLLWSAARGQVGIVTMNEAGPGVLTLQNGRGPMRKRIAARAFFRCFGVNPAPGTYPMERHSSGLLVATITQQPAQGGEA